MSIASNMPAGGLQFERSVSRAVAIEGGFTAKMSQYAPRIASILRLGSAGAVVGSGIQGLTVASEVTAASIAAPALVIGAGVMFIAACAVMILYGDKKKQAERATKEGGTELEPVLTDPISRIFHDIAKMATPSKYPIEAASGYGMVAGIFFAASGAVSGNLFLIGMGALAIISSSIALFGHEQNKPPTPATDGLQFEQSKSVAVGIENQPKSKTIIKNPVRVSSILSIINGGIATITGSSDADPFMMAAGIGTMVGHLIMAIFVKKNAFNVNAAKEQSGDVQPTKQVSEATSNKLNLHTQLGMA